MTQRYINLLGFKKPDYPLTHSISNSIWPGDAPDIRYQPYIIFAE